MLDLTSVRRRAALPAVSVVALLAAMPGGLAAETAAETQLAQAAQAPGVAEEIVVTGSRIVRDGYEAPTPVSVLGADELMARAPQNIADAVNALPSFANSRTPHSANSSTGNGTVGVNSLNLRGLNANRTLVLLDGQRLVGANANGSSEGNAVDVNVIPNALISRVDVVTGGASAAYGSDALSGVVNFVLDRDFTGIKGSVEGGVTTYGDSRNYAVSLTGGTPFAGGRGHILISGEHAYSEGVRGNPRPWFQDAAAQTLTNPLYTPTNGQPQLIVVRQAGIAIAAPGGLITSGPLKGIQFDADGNPYPFRYGPNGYVGNQMQGGDWELTRTDDTSSLQAKVNRKSLFTRVSYDLTDSVQVYGQLQWNHTHGSSQNAYGYKLGSDRINVDNPYIPASILDQMTALGLSQLAMGRNNIDLPIAKPNNDRTFRRYVVGAEGRFDAFGTAWTWDASYQRSTNHVAIRVLDNMVNANYLRAVDAVRNADGVIVCRVNADASSANDDPACKPLNYFGYGNVPHDVTDYIVDNGYGFTRLTQDVVAASAAGEPFSTWAGPVSLALGAEYRAEALDAFASATDIANGFFSGNYKDSQGSYNVTEGFIETLVPLAANEPWAQALDVNAAVRFTSYSASGYVTTWKIGGTWTPIDDIRFRATQSRDIRAPNLGDMFLGGRSNSTFTADPFRDNEAVTVFSITSGNPDLKPEKADTTGAGVVLSPRFLPGFNASADFYRIKINGAIATLSAQQIITQCHNGVTVLCPFLERDENGILTTVRIRPANVLSQSTKGFDFEAGYNMDLGALVEGWRGGLTLRGMGNYVISLRTVNSASTPTVLEGAGVNADGGVNGSVPLFAPKFRYSLSAAYDLDPVTVTLTLNGISSGKYNNSFVECTSGCPTSTAAATTINTNHIAAARSWDLSLNYKVLQDVAPVDVFFVVKNLTNAAPPLVGGGTTSGVFQGQANGALYADYRIGRTFRAGLRFRM